jgi:hypothetical protein
MYKYLIIFTLWILNLELSVGNVWLRPDVTGNTIFAPKNIINFMKVPFTMKEMWYFNMWDINIFIFFSFCLAYSYIILEFLQLE